jgi:hypothetical protein
MNKVNHKDVAIPNELWPYRDFSYDSVIKKKPGQAMIMINELEIATT